MGKQVGFCPHCCSRTPQTLAHKQRYRETLFEADGATSSGNVAFAYFVAVCESCDQVLLYHDVDDSVAQEFVEREMLFPRDGELHSSVPTRIRETYREAFTIRSPGPNAYATQIRRALEEITEDRGAGDGVLARRLEVLVERGELPGTLAEMSQVIRMLGNIAAHKGGISAAQVSVIDEFFRAVLEYVYVGPYKVAEYKRRLASLSGEMNAGAAG